MKSIWESLITKLAKLHTWNPHECTSSPVVYISELIYLWMRLYCINILSPNPQREEVFKRLPESASYLCRPEMCLTHNLTSNAYGSRWEGVELFVQPWSFYVGWKAGAASCRWQQTLSDGGCTETRGIEFNAARSLFFLVLPNSPVVIVLQRQLCQTFLEYWSLCVLLMGKDRGSQLAA